MRIKKYKYFFNFIGVQEKWLNKMSDSGYRLIGTNKLSYEFESCNSKEYEYCIEFVGNKSNKDIEEYKSFLEGMGYKVFPKNININYSVGKISWRPFSRGMGQIATKPGNYDKELLIIEKKRDGKPFNIYSNFQDLIKYYSQFKIMSVSLLVLDIVLLLLNFSSNIITLNTFTTIILLLLAVIFTIQTIGYTLKINKFKNSSKTNE